MISKTLKLLTVIALISTVGSIALLSFFEVQVKQTSVEREIKISEFLK